MVRSPRLRQLPSFRLVNVVHRQPRDHDYGMCDFDVVERRTEAASSFVSRLTKLQLCCRKMSSTSYRTLEMTEYVIREVGFHQWLVFADRKSIAFCADENEAVRVMTEHSARSRRSRDPADIAPEPPVGAVART